MDLKFMRFVLLHYLIALANHKMFLKPKAIFALGFCFMKDLNLWRMIIPFFWMICHAQSSNGQAGVYVGNLVSHRNALALTIKDTIATGNFFTDQYETFPFQGFFNKNVLRGYFLEYGTPRVILGRLQNDTLKVDLFSSKSDSIEKRGVLVRVSSNPNYNVERIFAKEKIEHDERLIGKWKIVKSVNSKGENVLEEIYTEEYLRHGVISFNGPTLNKMLESPAFQRIIKPTTSWQTKAGKIISQSNLHGTSEYPVPRELIERYYISNDTLITQADFKKYFIKVK